ncbi:MAG: spore coat associated protein CotJA [Oscillospiraceae bacterium]|nr:spore coat associated protein CotJA [Oscillospiraceae bacterium]
MELHAFQKLAENAEMHTEISRNSENLENSVCETAGLQPQPMTVFPDVTPVGMAYVPYQLWGDIYDSKTGFQQGTMFPVLDMPFQPEGGICQ